MQTLDHLGSPKSRTSAKGHGPALLGVLSTLVPPAWPALRGPVRLAGELDTAGALCDIVALVAQTARSGTLVVASDAAVRALDVDKGRLAGAATTATHERMGELLYAAGIVSRDDVDAAAMLAAVDGRRFGEILLTLGCVTRSELDRMRAEQAAEIFYGALGVTRGVFGFVDQRLGLATVPDDALLPLEGFLLEAARRLDEKTAGRPKREPERSSIAASLAAI